MNKKTTHAKLAKIHYSFSQKQTTKAKKKKKEINK